MAIKETTLKKDMIMIGLGNILECRIMTPEFITNPDENILWFFLGDDEKLSQESINCRDELFHFLKTRYDYKYIYWIEIRPNTENQLKIIHIIRPDRLQYQWIDMNGIVTFKAGRYDIFKFPQFGFSVYVYD